MAGIKNFDAASYAAGVEKGESKVVDHALVTIAEILATKLNRAKMIQVGENHHVNVSSISEIAMTGTGCNIIVGSVVYHVYPPTGVTPDIQYQVLLDQLQS